MRFSSLLRAVSVCVAILLTASPSQGADTYFSVVLQKTDDDATSAPVTITVPAGKVLEQMMFTSSTYSPTATVSLNGMPLAYSKGATYPTAYTTSQGGVAYSSQAPDKLVVAGPATLTLAFSSTPQVAGHGCLLTYRLKDSTENEAVLSAAAGSSVVIPTDATGPVQVIMESSTDLITWTAATPGTYGANTTKRFFRLRAVAN